MKLLLLVFIVLDSLVVPTDTLEITAADVQRLKENTYALFDLYEKQLLECEGAKENIRLVSIKNIEANLRQIDRFQYQISSVNRSLLEMSADNRNLQTDLEELEKALKKAKRKAWIERACYTVTAVAILLIVTGHPP